MLFRPQWATMARIVEHQRPTWRTPLTLVILAAIGNALAAGSIKAAAAASGQITFPPGFEFTHRSSNPFQQAARPPIMPPSVICCPPWVRP